MLRSALGGLGCQRHVPPSLPCERTPVHKVQEAEWTLGTVWTGTKKRKSFEHTGVQTQNRPARS